MLETHIVAEKQSYSQSAIQLMQLCEHRNRARALEKDVLRFYQEKKGDGLRRHVYSTHVF